MKAEPSGEYRPRLVDGSMARVFLARERPIRDNSFLWHVRAGRFRRLGRGVERDPFSLAFGGQTLADAVLVAGAHLRVRWARELAWVGGFVGMMAGPDVGRRSGVPCSRRPARVARWTGGLLIWLEVMALPYFAPSPVVVSFVLLPLPFCWCCAPPGVRWSIPLHDYGCGRPCTVRSFLGSGSWCLTVSRAGIVAGSSMR